MFFMYSMILFMILLSILFVTLMERKFLGILNNRKSPNYFFINSLLQSLMDFFKLIFKKTFKMNFVIKKYWMAMIFMGVMMFLCLYLNYPLNNVNTYMFMNFLFFFLIYSMMSFFFLVLSFSSNSMFSMMALYRVMTQIISYEVGLIFLFIFPLMFMNEMNFYYFNKNSNFIMTFSMFYMLMLFMVVLSEMNRVPFDFLESETELVSGFNVEYFSSMFSFIFLIEYGFFLFMSLMLNFFLTMNFSMVIYLLMVFIWLRSFMPRFRYDKMIMIFWKDLILMILMFMLMLNFM